MEGLEDEDARPRQVRYQAALRPDILCFLDFKPLSQFPIPSGLPKSTQKPSDRGQNRDKTPSVGPPRVKTRTVLIGLPVQLLQSLPFHLQFHLRKPFSEPARLPSSLRVPGFQLRANSMSAAKLPGPAEAATKCVRAAKTVKKMAITNAAKSLPFLMLPSFLTNDLKY